jgi:hypothetical protein
MPTGKLEWELPEEEMDFRLATHAVDWALTVSDIDNKLRGLIKYGHALKTADKALECISEYLYHVMEERGISLDDIE